MKSLKPLFTITLSAFALIISTFANAQSVNIRDSSVSLSMINVHYAFYVPSGDLKTRFGNSIEIGTGFLRKTKSNYLWGAEINYLSGSDVKENYILDSIKTSRGQFITYEGRFADVRTTERGISAYLQAGKIFPVFGSNKNNGIMALVGVGFLQHQINIEVLEENVVALNGDYRKGYDRLTNGISFNQFIGYHYLSNRLRFNLYAGLDFSQSLTKNRRDWDYFEKRKLTESRVDKLNGFKVALILPLYQRKPKDYYYR